MCVLEFEANLTKVQKMKAGELIILEKTLGGMMIIGEKKVTTLQEFLKSIIIAVVVIMIIG